MFLSDNITIEMGRFFPANVPLWVLTLAQLFNERIVNEGFSGTVKCLSLCVRLL